MIIDDLKAEPDIEGCEPMSKITNFDKQIVKYWPLPYILFHISKYGLKETCGHSFIIPVRRDKEIKHNISYRRVINREIRGNFISKACV